MELIEHAKPPVLFLEKENSEAMNHLRSMNHAARLTCLTLFTICATLFACQKPPRDRGEAVTRMVQLQESGHYDDAVRVVEDWMNQHQNDASQNDFLHLQIAMVYISKLKSGW